MASDRDRAQEFARQLHEDARRIADRALRADNGTMDQSLALAAQESREHFLDSLARLLTEVRAEERAICFCPIENSCSWCSDGSEECDCGHHERGPGGHGWKIRAASAGDKEESDAE